MRISRPLVFAVVVVLAFAFQASGRAQGNMVDFYGWNPVVLYGPQSAGPSVISSGEVEFFVQPSTNYPNPPFTTIPGLTSILDTTPGSTYEISYNATFGAHSLIWSLSVEFGNDTFDIGPGGAATNFFDFMDTATSPNTAMTIRFSGDNGDSIDLSNFTVTEVPEPPVVGLLGLGGGIVLLVLSRRRGFQLWTRN